MNNSDYLYDLFTEEAKAVLPEAHVPASGWSPNKLLGTDRNGNVVEKDNGGLSFDGVGGAGESYIFGDGLNVDMNLVSVDTNDIATRIGFVTPQMYGAVGDNETDDSEAFQQAVDSGCNVIIPPGNYKVANISITKSIYIRGIDNPLLTVPENVYSSADSYPNVSSFILNGVSGVVVEGVRFNGSWLEIAENNYASEGCSSYEYMANRNTNSFAVRILSESENVTIKACKFDNFKDACVQIAELSKHITIENNVFNENGWNGCSRCVGVMGVQTKNPTTNKTEPVVTYLTIRNNRILNCGSHGINLYAYNKHSNIIGNYIENCGLVNEVLTDTIDGICIKLAGATEVRILENICINGIGGAIAVYDETNLNPTYNITNVNVIIANNRIIGSDSEVSAGSGIATRDVGPCLIVNNIVENVKLHAQNSDASAIYCRRGAIVSHNIVRDSYYGIRVTNGNGTGNGTIISNNRIDATSPIYAFNMDGAIITNNRLTADGATTVVRLGNINNCQISGNVLFNATRGFTIANGIDNTQIYGNVYNGITTTIYIPSNVTAGNYSVDFTPVTAS